MYKIEIRDKKTGDMISQVSINASSDEEIVKKAHKAVLKPEIEELTSIVEEKNNRAVSF